VRGELGAGVTEILTGLTGLAGLKNLQFWDYRYLIPQFGNSSIRYSGAKGEFFVCAKVEFFVCNCCFPVKPVNPVKGLFASMPLCLCALGKRVRGAWTMAPATRKRLSTHSKWI
jgi:hypothetical protein